MNYKKKIIIISLFLILSIQILLLINNRQKTSFRYLIWKVEEVSIGRLVCISFISGLLISTLLNKTISNHDKNYQKIEDELKETTDNDYSKNTEDENEFYEIPPERDLRDTQPTISVNYRVIKENKKNDSNNGGNTSRNPKYQDDWINNDSEW
tara:strand:+ start:103 stop:561 length:459 start_codon:yes stop_codon:yes gene_type:complete